MVRLIALGIAALVTAACGQPQAGDALGVPPEAIVRFGDDIGAARVVEGRLEVVVLDRRNVASVIGAWALRGDGQSLRLISYGGNSGEAWNSFVFGTVRPGVAEVRLGGFGRPAGGRVVRGAWLIVLREKDVGPGDLHWTFHGPDGGLVEEGTGIFPPDA